MIRRGVVEEGTLVATVVLGAIVVISIVVGVTILSYNVVDRALTNAEKVQAEKAPVKP